MKKTRQIVIVCLLLALLMAVISIPVVMDYLMPPQPTESPTLPPQTEPTQTVPTQPQETEPTAVTESLNVQPSVPLRLQATWLTFPADRELTAKQYFVYSINDDAFLTISGQPEDRIYQASITKLFSVHVALQYLQPDQIITAGDALELVAEGSSIAVILPEEQLTAEMLVEAMLLPSGNDAACIVSVEVGRILADDPALPAQEAVDRFVEEMNRQAAELGMTGTHFVTPDGIHDDDHYTSFADLVSLAKLTLKNETVMPLLRLPKDTAVPVSGQEKLWKNTNFLINPDSKYYCPYAIGLKTGQTVRAGSCLLSAFEYNGKRLIIGVFGCSSVADRFCDTLQLFNETMGFLPPVTPEPTVPEPTE